jgi:ribosomal protein L40E
MKRCNDCGTISADPIPFCPTCGSSFGTKLCPRLHPNPLTATYCRTCGSPQLSRPHHIPERPHPRRLAVALALLTLPPVSLAIALITTLPHSLSLSRLLLFLVPSAILLLLAIPFDPKNSNSS